MVEGVGERSERSFNLERKVVISEELDGLIEQCRHARLALAEAAGRILPRSCELLEARGALMRGLDEQLDQRVYRAGEFAPDWEALVPEAFDAPLPENGVFATADATVIVRRLDCAEEIVGLIAFAFPAGLRGAALERARDECRTAAEQIDNFLEGIASAAMKQRLSVTASAALRAPVLEQGADQAIEVLSRALGIEEVALIYTDSDVRGRGGLHYRLYRQGTNVADSIDKPDKRLDDAIWRAGANALDPMNHEVAQVFGGPGCVEEALINGLVNVAPVGKLIVRNSVGNLDPAGMDVLRLFGECLSQRLVDYNRERRVLSQHFSPSDVTKLVRDPEYIHRYLEPRVEPVGILFSDVSSFTAISERVLPDASAIGELIDIWADNAVKILHRHGGAFDKLVGDCVIGLFGPPFFASAPVDRVAAAIRAGVDIARMTRELGASHGYDAKIQELGVGPGLGVATGVNFGPTWVGLVGPNQDYTGFSSHMNNAARLQGLAKWQEVLVMDGVRELIGARLDAEGLRFEGPEQAKVKNVKDPISFFKVKW